MRSFCFALFAAAALSVVSIPVTEPPSSWAGVSTWDCVEQEATVVSPAVTYTRQNCTGVTPKGNVGPMIFHLTRVDLSSPSVKLVPQVAPNGELCSVDQMAPAKALAGINGGYFWRVDSKKFVDDVCWGKTREDALKAASVENSNWGLGDGLVIRDGVLLSSNCDKIGNSVPALLVINGTGSHVVVQKRGEGAPAGVTDGLAAGPNLVSENKHTGEPEIDIEGLNINIWEHSANTAVGLNREGGEMKYLTMVTTDGHDGCARSDQTCGLDAKHMAYFMRDYIKATQAMEMDQGGSTTMWVSGKGIVSNGGTGARNVYSSLFVVEV